jgi:hypothetical protein
MLSSPELLLYQWIADVQSPDVQTSITALKSLSAQLKKDPSVFTSHVDDLMLTVLLKMRTQFAVVPLPVRTCKYLSFFILTLFSEMRLGATVSEDVVSQLVFEVLKNLAAGTSEQVLVQVQNAIIRKLIDESPVYAFRAFLKAIGDYKGDPAIEKRTRFALKCFEAAGARLAEVGSDADVSQAAELVQATVAASPEAGPIGEKIHATLRAFADQAAARAPAAGDAADLVVGVRPPGKGGARKIIAPEIPKRASPLRHLRVPR